MPDANPILTNAAFGGMIEESKLKPESKELLISKLPDLDEEQRLELLDFLMTMSFLEDEREEVKARVKRFEETGKFE